MYCDVSTSTDDRQCARSSETKYTIGSSSAILPPRNPQRRNRVDHDSFCYVTRYSPNGREVVAGSARHASSSEKRNISFGPRVRSVSGVHAKSPSMPSGFGADMSQFVIRPLYSEAGLMWPITSPVRPAMPAIGFQ